MDKKLDMFQKVLDHAGINNSTINDSITKRIPLEILKNINGGSSGGGCHNRGHSKAGCGGGGCGFSKSHSKNCK